MVQNDVDSWMDAADNRRGPISDVHLLEFLKAHNSYRWWRLNHDWKWAKKMAKKRGCSVEQLRQLLP